MTTDWLRRTALLAVTIALSFLNPPWRDLIYLPVAFSAVLDGWRFGLIAGVLAGAGALWNEAPLQALSLCLIGGVAGLYTDRERRERRRCQEVAAQLSTVCEQLQTDFEGMKRAERLSAIGQLSAGLAHEIRNPLASIAGAASILRRSGYTDAKATKCLDIIESECNRLNGLLTTFLNFARPRPPQLQSIAVERILNSVTDLARHAIGSKSIEFRIEVESGMPSLECDPEQMTQVVLNLVINATEASDPGSVVTLAADQVEGSARIRVIDKGEGVPPEDIDKLFNPFFTTKETGTGLGLPVAHQIVTQMGGLLTARRNPIRGMTFSIEFPLKHSRR